MINTQPLNKSLLITNIVIALIYLGWWFNPSHIGNIYLYLAILIGEIYHVFLAMSFWHTLWPSQNVEPIKLMSHSELPSVDIFITVAGEPVEIVEKTALAAKNLDYPNFQVHILNDGYVAKKANWQDIQNLAKTIGINCITRTTPGGAKAGNINHALSQTHGQIIAVFDADMVPQPNFLTKVMSYFSDPKVGFVQTPQYYQNYYLNQVTGGAWEQQEFFFGPIMVGKDKTNSSFICGTNFAIRRKALTEVGGMCEDNIAEDFLTSLFIHQKGWRSHYLPQILSKGLAPEDLLSYYKQQLRWARGSLEVLFAKNPLFKSGLTWHQKIEYLSSALYYLNGLIVLIDCLMPVIMLAFGLRPVSSSTTSFSLFFLPFILLTLFTLYSSTGNHLTFRAISFSHSSFTLQLQALVSVLFKQKMAFAVTSKTALSGNFLKIVYPHLIYLFIAILSIAIGIHRDGLNASTATNIAWVIFNIILFLPFIKAAYNWSTVFKPLAFKRVAYEQTD